jgi:hypothetical protein
MDDAETPNHLDSPRRPRHFGVVERRSGPGFCTQSASAAADFDSSGSAGRSQAQSSPTNPPEAQPDKLVDEAVAAVRETQNALTAIDQNKNDDAIAALERATGKLEIVLARTPTRLRSLRST